MYSRDSLLDCQCQLAGDVHRLESIPTKIKLVVKNQTFHLGAVIVAGPPAVGAVMDVVRFFTHQ